MNINQKINAKGNRLIFYPSTKDYPMIILIKQNYKFPYEEINLPNRLYIKDQYSSNYKGH